MWKTQFKNVMDGLRTIQKFIILACKTLIKILSCLFAFRFKNNFLSYNIYGGDEEVKLKIKQKPDRTIVQVMIQRNEELIERELKTLTMNSIKNLFRPTLKKGFLFYRYSINYVGPHCVPLTQYLKSTISKQNFYYILAQIIAVTNYLQISNMSLKNLLLDLRYIFINISTNELFFVYLPILSNSVSVDLIGFFGTLLHSTNPDRNENNGYLGEFSTFLGKQSSFSVEAFKNYICSKDDNAAAQLKRLMSGQSGFITDKRADYYDHYYDNHSSTGYQAVPNEYNGNEDTTLLNNSYDDFNFGKNDTDDYGTTILSQQMSDIEEGTTVLNKNNCYAQPVQKFPYLIRILTNERIEINKPVFRLGKESRYVDYFISNNNAISRSHADIITRNGHYYVIDLHTTNYTYINDSMIIENTEVEIFDGNILKLANEEFEFHVQ